MGSQQKARRFLTLFFFFPEKSARCAPGIEIPAGFWYPVGGGPDGRAAQKRKGGVLMAAVKGRFAPTPSGNMHVGNALCYLLACCAICSPGSPPARRAGASCCASRTRTFCACAPAPWSRPFPTFSGSDSTGKRAPRRTSAAASTSSPAARRFIISTSTSCARAAWSIPASARAGTSAWPPRRTRATAPPSIPAAAAISRRGRSRNG